MPRGYKHAQQTRTLQIRLYRAAKQSLARRFGALYDKVYREDVLWTAWARVRANRGAPGVDEQDFETIEREIGVEKFQAEIAEALRTERYRPLPVRRCWIEKPGKPEKRPLGIPVIRDRVVQAAVKLVLEPIFEANFLRCSYGFRPKRSAQMAIREIQRAITFDGQCIIIDADIRAYFDSIDQELLMNLVQRRVSDRRVLKLLRGWLRAGVMDGTEYVPSDGRGTPQGGVISPLLANIYLHPFDKMIEQAKIPGTLVRYADDIVLLLRRDGRQVLNRVHQILGRLKLELHRDKTRVVSAEDGFDFLGVHFRLCRVRKPKAKIPQSCRVWPSDRSIRRIRARIREVIGHRYGETLETIIADLNPVLRGWNAYHASIQPERRRFRVLHRFLVDRLRIFVKRKYSDRSRGHWRVSGQTLARLGLFQLGGNLGFNARGYC